VGESLTRRKKKKRPTARRGGKRKEESPLRALLGRSGQEEKIEKTGNIETAWTREGPLTKKSWATATRKKGGPGTTAPARRTCPDGCDGKP